MLKVDSVNSISQLWIMLGSQDSAKDPILDKDSLAVASAPAEIVPETTVAPPNGLTASSSNLLCL